MPPIPWASASWRPTTLWTPPPQGFKDALTEAAGRPGAVRGAATPAARPTTAPPSSTASCLRGCGPDPGQRHRLPAAPPPPPPPTSPSWAPPSPTTAWRWTWTALDGQGPGRQHLRHLRPGASGPAGRHARRRCSRRHRTWACSTAPPSPTPCIQVDTVQGYLERHGLHLHPVRLHRRPTTWPL